MMELRTAIFTYAYLKHSNSRSTCQNYKSKGLIFLLQNCLANEQKTREMFWWPSYVVKNMPNKKNKKL